jgi:predicted 3-demethylubiquinone-9 3-methyltransferase (glyoxalase superfamily)
MTGQITPCLWFDSQAEEAANFYVSVFSNDPVGKGNSEIGIISRYGKEGYEIHGRAEGTAMTVSFRLNGQSYTALNGGPVFKMNEAISMQVYCDTQGEIDYFWENLSAEGEEGQCGWLKDKFGLSWQIIPSILPLLMSHPTKAGRVTRAFLQMKKLDIEKLINA